MNRDQAAMEFLEPEYLWHIDMLEALKRGRGEVVYFKGQTARTSTAWMDIR